jgi:hypothetical protein
VIFRVSPFGWSPSESTPGSVIGGEAALVYASERFLDYRGWPAYARTCADIAVGAVLAAMEWLDEAWGMRLAIFHAENWTKSWSVVAVGDDLIVIEQGDDPDLPRIQSEYRHAGAMRALIRQAETKCQTTSRTLRRSPAGSALSVTTRARVFGAGVAPARP